MSFDIDAATKAYFDEVRNEQGNMPKEPNYAAARRAVEEHHCDTSVVIMADLYKMLDALASPKSPDPVQLEGQAQTIGATPQSEQPKPRRMKANPYYQDQQKLAVCAHGVEHDETAACQTMKHSCRPVEPEKVGIGGDRNTDGILWEDAKNQDAAYTEMMKEHQEAENRHRPLGDYDARKTSRMHVIDAIRLLDTIEDKDETISTATCHIREALKHDWIRELDAASAEIDKLHATIAERAKEIERLKTSESTATRAMETSEDDLRKAENERDKAR